MRFLKLIWRAITGRSRHFSLGFLTLGGFVGGVVFWGGFNTALEASNRLEFCTSCHAMREFVFEELKQTAHRSNASGVLATCSDCHVPHEWTHKIARKMQASKELWGWVFGTIDTREEFEAHRKVMAEREWARMIANDSRECRNCHDAAAMDLGKQSERAARNHRERLLTGTMTCIECHQGIAHKLPPPDEEEGDFTL